MMFDGGKSEQRAKVLANIDQINLQKINNQMTRQVREKMKKDQEKRLKDLRNKLDKVRFEQCQGRLF